MQILQPTPQAVYSGVINALSKISTTEGHKTLWRGVNSVILGAGPAHALYFGTYEYAKHAFGGNESGHHLIAAGKSQGSIKKKTRRPSWGHTASGIMDSDSEDHRHWDKKLYPPVRER